MSIQDFHAQLTMPQDQDALMGTLRRLSLIEDLQTVVHDPVSPSSGEWGPWTS
jgi:hypothetical protein